MVSQSRSQFVSSIVVLATLAILLLSVAPVLAADPLPPAKPKAPSAPLPVQSLAQKYEKLAGQFRQSRMSEMAARMSAQTPQDMKRAEAKHIEPETWARKFLWLAQGAPQDAAALTALIDAAAIGAFTPTGEEAIANLRKYHLKNPRLGKLFTMVELPQTAENEHFLREVIAENPSHFAQGLATYYLANMKWHQGDRPGAKVLLRRVISQYADVRSDGQSIKKVAEFELKGIDTFAVGHLSPEIIGTDAWGKKFKMSDYKGRVIVVDFFGDW